MKTKFTLIIAIMALTFSSGLVAQADCTVAVSLFTEPAKVKNYEAALPHYSKVVQDCPTTTMATYQYGVKMFKYFISKGDKGKITDLENAYKMRMQHFPSKSKKGDILSDIAQIRYDNKIGTKAEQFKSFDQAFKADEATFKSPKRIYTYFSLARDLFDAGQKDIQEVFDLYDVMQDKIDKEESFYAAIVTQLGDKEEAGTVLTAKEKKKLKGSEKNLVSYGKIRGSIDTKLGAIADCTNLIPLYQKLWEEKKNDVNWLKSAAGKLNAKDCDTPMFFQMVQQLHSLQPSAKSAFYLGRLADKDGNSSQALEYYNQAVELEGNPSDKAKYLYTIAENFKKKGSFGKARSYYLKAIEQKPSMGVAYLKIGSMYAQSSNNCGSNVFEKRAINWKAAEMANKAARVDGSIASNARAAASSYMQRAPSKSDIFSSGMAGKKVSFSCWVGGSVRVPNL